MSELFNKDFLMLKLYSLQMNRMLGIVDSNLFEHLDSLKISASFYSSFWFITLFTSVQNRTQMSKRVWLISNCWSCGITFYCRDGKLQRSSSRSC